MRSDVRSIFFSEQPENEVENTESSTEGSNEESASIFGNGLDW